MKYYIGVDIGGTKVLAILADKNAQIIDKYQTKSLTESAETLFDSVTQSIDILLENNNISTESVEAIGVGLPGLVDSESGIAVYQSNIPWGNFPITDRLTEKYQTKVIIDNDVAVAAYSEWHALRSSKSFVYITVSTGIAMMTILNGNIVRGNGFAGELGQTLVYVNGEYKRLENTISGPALAKTFRKVMNDESLSTKDLFNQYDSNSKAKEIVEYAAELLSVSIYDVNAILDPDTIVLGGSVMTNNPLFLEQVKINLAEILLPDQRHILENIHISSSNNIQGATGALLLAIGK